MNNIFGTKKNFGISDSLLDVVRGVVKGEELEEKKLDPVNQKALKKDFDDLKDKDIDNDGDVDSSDEYLHNRRKAISKAMGKGKKDEVDTDPKLDEEALDEAMRVLAKKGDYQVATKGDGVAHVMYKGKKVGSGDLDNGAGGWFMNIKGMKGQQFFDSPQKIVDFFMQKKITEGLEDNTRNPANSQHLCAKQVVHESWGQGTPIHGEHAQPDTDGHIAWYDVMFDHGIEQQVSIDEMKVVKSEMHGNHKKKK
jgi:hypothetical protein